MSRPPVTVPAHETAILRPAAPPVVTDPRYGWERAQRGLSGGLVTLFGAFCVAWPVTDHLVAALVSATMVGACVGAWMASWTVDPRDIRASE